MANLEIANYNPNLPPGEGFTVTERSPLPPPSQQDALIFGKVKRLKIDHENPPLLLDLRSLTVSPLPQ